MTSDEMLYVKGAKIWVANEEHVWESATIVENYAQGSNYLKVCRDNYKDGEEAEINVKINQSALPPLRNPAILIGQNDLTSLSYLHEPGVLHNLRVRFCEKQIIYTYCGIILVAINPYAELPLYGPSIIRAYRGRSIGELEPHIFALSEEAYAKLERENCNLSIIVSGESGAGKTVSAKYAMRYFAAVGGSESETQVERKVLASSPIMEAFGNAKTTRNDNSSRFGKFIKLLFKNELGSMILTGATMNTYLLEKSRVVFQSNGERNYHIFYQLCSMRGSYHELILDHQDKFEYLKKGKSPDIEKISDKEQFRETLQAMQILGFTNQQITDLLKILASILHLGNINFVPQYKPNTEEIDPDACDILPNDLHLHITGELLKISSDDLRQWLMYRQIASGNENVLIPNNIELAAAAKDALAKHIYSKLFQYVVNVINKSLNIGRHHGAGNFIGVLDIYGFETFDNNSFEQFCINYANEKLQQQFNQHVFKLEQEEYLKEGITWTMIDFYDNQPCIDLIEAKLGVLDLLDEECRMPKGSDESWAQKLFEKCSKYQHFGKARFGTTSFLITHFSDTVQYDVNGFLEKNRDTVSKELVNVIRKSDMELCKQIMELEETDILSEDADKMTTLGGRVVISAARKQVAPSKQHKRSVGSQFRDSLSSLIKTLHCTVPHYVRCIKPNDDKIAFKWEPVKIVQQLRACGVLETVRISAAGFPSRWLYYDFYMRYQLLCHRSELNKNDVKGSCKKIVLKWTMNEDKYRFGNSQIFFRAGQVAYLEQIRANLRKRYIIIVQSMVRRYLCRKRYMQIRKCIIGLQCYSRGYLARKKTQRLREERAAMIIAKYAKGYLCRRRYLRLCKSVLGIQQYARGMLARKRFHIALDNYKATQVQRFIRGYLARKNYERKLHHIIICQAAIRRFLARRQFRKIKAEAKSISYMEKKYKGLENKIISMQQKIDELNKENINLKQRTAEISILKMKLETKKNIEVELKNLKVILIEKDEFIDRLSKNLESEKVSNEKILEANAQIRREQQMDQERWQSEKDELVAKIEEISNKAKSLEVSKVQQEAQLISDAESKEINEAYQRALKEKDAIENENHWLKEELKKLGKEIGTTAFGYHRRSISNASSHNDDDIGYVSAKNTIDSRSAVNVTDDNAVAPYRPDQTSLILKLRSILEEEKLKNKSLKEKLSAYSLRPVMQHEDSVSTHYKISELELENEKLRSDYTKLRQSIEMGKGYKELNDQFQAMEAELTRRREEIIHLKAVLQEQNQSLKYLESDDSKKGVDYELMQAFQCQKFVNRQLEAELAALTEENNAHLLELTVQIDHLREEKNQLQEVLNAGLENLDDSNLTCLKQNESYLKLELEKAIKQYLELQEETNNLNKKLEALKKGNENLSSKINERPWNFKDANLSNSGIAQIGKQKTHTYQGLMKFQEANIKSIIRILVLEMQPKIYIKLMPGLPAYILFMCIRYTDLINADAAVSNLLTLFVKHIQKLHRSAVVPEMRTMWIVNSIVLLNLMKQYGDCEEYIKYNTEKQNEQQLKNFNLAQYRKIILEIIIRLYQALVKQIQASLEVFLVPGMLYSDEIQSSGHGYGMRGRMTFSNHQDANKELAVGAKKQIIGKLNSYYEQFKSYGLDNCYAEQIFYQLMYYICAVSMNFLMVRGDIFGMETGLIIRYNVGHIEKWIHDKEMSKDILAPLNPLIAMSQLLQSRKSESDVDSISDICASLNTAQVLKVMKSYKTFDESEGEITNNFIEMLTKKLEAREFPKNNDDFTMDQKFIHPFNVVYKHSNVKLEDIELPTDLGLDEILQKI